MKIVRKATKLEKPVLECGDIIVTHTSYFLVLPKMVNVGYSNYSRNERFTAVNISQNVVIAHEYDSLSALQEHIADGNEIIEIIKAEDFSLVVSD
jgi:hypothetical protein